DPYLLAALNDDPLRTQDREEAFLTVLEVTAIRQRDDWQKVSGRVRLTAGGGQEELRAGNGGEVQGLLGCSRVHGKPGVRDRAAQLLDDGIRATLLVRRQAGGITRLDGGGLSLSGWFGMMRSWGARACVAYLPADTGGLAAALLLGETSALPARE